MKVALVAYKIEAGKGSEDSSGYNFATGLIERGVDLTIITRKNNTTLLEKDPLFANVRVIGIDVPRWLAFYKSKGRGITLYYYLWQMFVGTAVKKLRTTDTFDVIHLFNFHTDWAPHFLSNPDGAMVWGPVAHHEKVPADFLRYLGGSAGLGEWRRYLAKQCFWRLDPFLRTAVRRTDVVIYANKRVAPPFEAARRRIYFRPYATSSEGLLDAAALPARFRILTVGRLIPLKGFDAALDGFATFLKANPEANAELVIVGTGPLRDELNARASDLGVGANVEFVEWLPQAALAGHYQAAAAFLFPSFEAQGLVVAEAMAAGLPVVCLEASGPAFVAGDTALIIPRARYDQVVQYISDHLRSLWRELQTGDAYGKRMEKVRSSYFERLSTARLVDDILDVYSGALNRRTGNG